MLYKYLVVAFYTLCVPLFSILLYTIIFLNGLEEIIKFGREPEIKTEYEVIIVGAGAAGSTILSEIRTNDVLVIEAGDELFSAKNTLFSHLGNLLLKIPILTPLLQRYYLFDWRYKTEPQKFSAYGLKNNVSYWPAGKGYGGSQLINDMVYCRGNENDYRDWFTESGRQYNFTRDVLPYFEKLEQDNEIEELRFTTKLSDAFLKVTNRYETSRRHKIKSFKPKVTQKKGERWTFGDNYHYKHKPGHRILFGAHVEKIVLTEAMDDTSKLEATGVVFKRHGRHHTVYAKKKIILSAGTVGSPAILLQSGIGPSELYEELNSTIKLLKHLPAVGQNLQDHVLTGLDLILLKENLHLYPWNVLSPGSLINYFLNGTGPMTMGGCEALGFVKTLLETSADTLPGLGFVVVPVGASIDGGVYIRHNFNLKEEVWREYFKPLISKSSVSILPILWHPKSQGHVTLKFHAVNGYKVVIDPKYLSHPDDVILLVEGIKIVRELIKTKPFRELGAEINTTPFPGCETEEFGSNRYWNCYVRHLTLTSYHPMGTCRMGHDEETSVVHPDTFQVHGIKNLFVCDASIAPSLPSGNPQSVVGMLAKRFLEKINKAG